MQALDPEAMHHLAVKLIDLAYAPAGAAEMLAIQPDSETKELCLSATAKYVPLIKEEAVSLRELSRVAMARQGDMSYWKLSAFDLADMVRKLTVSYSDRAKAKGVSLETVLGEVPQAFGDESAINRLVSNLIVYPLGVIPEHGKLRIELEKAGTNIRLTVTDSSHSLSLDDLKHFFDPFYYRPHFTRAGADSCGLLLALVKEVAEAHKGSVRAEPADQEGVRVVVELPSVLRKGEFTDSPSH